LVSLPENLKLGLSRENPWDYIFSKSPLGGHQGSIGQIFGIPYKPDGLISYVIEGFGGVHDTFNQPFYYNANGSNRLLHGSFEKVLGKIINPVNVLLASPIVLPALVPDYMRHLYFQEKY
jgi:hypothetical protein